MDAAASVARAADTAALRALRPDRSAARTVAAVCSDSVERGRLWIGLTAVTALSATTRRPGIEGLAGWAVGSGTAFALKGLVGRRRPAQRLSFGSAPSSSSMPSSHTASALGYATAAALRTPAVGPILGPLALAVAWSRTATGRHFPTDVVVGAVVGVGAGTMVHVMSRRLERHEPGPGD